MLVFWLVLIGTVLLLLASGGYVFAAACLRRKEIDWLDETMVRATPYGKYYPVIVEADRWLKEHQAQDVFITSREGLRLHGLWIPAEDAKGTMILFHGYRSTYLVDFSVALDYYHDKGFNLLIPDQRSHGRSEGKYITFGVKESEDALRWIGYHNRELSHVPVILSGLSMGASTVLFLADEDLPHNVRGIIADCGFTSPKEILSEVYKKVTHLPPMLSLWAADLFARAFADFSLSQKDTRKTLANNRVPILMVHGTQDSFVPCQMSRDGYACCTGKKTLLLVEGADHGVSFIVDHVAYSKAIDKFLMETLEDN